MSSLKAYFQLLRPPNLVTAITDVLAGVAVAVGWSLIELPSAYFPISPAIIGGYGQDWPWLVLATLGLYGGGVVLNDFYDADLDSLERPERPIPSGKVPRLHAGWLGYILLTLGVGAAFKASFTSGAISLVIVVLVIIYDKLSKNYSIWGPLNMGLCRGCNLMLGISAVPVLVSPLLFLSIIPIIYISAITLISRGEVHGNTRRNFNLGLGLYVLVGAMILSLGLLPQYQWWFGLPFLMVVVLIVLPPLIKARKTNRPELIGRAVKAGVLALIPLNAALAAGFTGLIFGLLLLLLLPLSLLLAKIFAVT